ncbi:hypothetical protein BO85DRAFT_517363 [Aspergillus piperis CBS 112811]|uniref:Thioesterase/thiol ester dehydrase-isomerase n=1 Tax=Aspergillus piperis CBS 112811 TaxID=1448313 RepID=A0A8G1RB20_9EURO|nr:hypothetical protein BO85DRAFT_517363 [Aspergillus piperis CBS 112811]RAH61155.1 hypothetical protein BO85DRAFT_517363 [Aspergillus piperis CBS 112811]
MADLSTLREVILPTLFSWKSLAIVLALLNLKNIPFSWHIRLLTHLLLNLRRSPTSPPFPTCPPSPTLTSKNQKNIQTHPIFHPHTLTTRTSLWETDYNFHKSNSTYFSDLDISRTAIVTRVYTPGLALVSLEFDHELKNGKDENAKVNVGKKVYVALGSTFTSFKREIGPLQRYRVLSRVVGWDRKWVYVLSAFVGMGSGNGKNGGKANGKVFATAVSKYVVKKGWVTVPPERVLRASGMLPERSVGDGEGEDGVVVEEEEEGTVEGIVEGVGEVLSKDDNNATGQGVSDWTWEMIEEERVRGMKIVEGYVGLDEKLLAEWE